MERIKKIKFQSLIFIHLRMSIVFIHSMSYRKLHVCNIIIKIIMLVVHIDIDILTGAFKND